MNPHATPSHSPRFLLRNLWQYRSLIQQMIGREIAGRYKGSVLGLTWSFFNPLFMLTVYTYVFSEIFQSHWSGTKDMSSKTEFATILFSGMIFLNLFNEVLNRAPGLILSNTNYVKKVVFPLEILPIISMGASLFHSLVSISVLLLALIIFNGHIAWTAIFLPLILIPLVLLTTGIAWILASLGVFLRDVGQTVSLLTLVLTFLSPVFYPVTAVPERFRQLMLFNPLTFVIEQAREVLIWGQTPAWTGLIEYSLASACIAWLGYFWFQKTRKGFADVL